MRRVFVALTLCCAWIVARADGSDTAATYLDLQPQANQKLTEDFHKLDGNTLKDLSQGEQIFADIKFKIGQSVIQLVGTYIPNLPDRVEGIKVDKAFRKLRILHATGWGAPD